LLRKLDEKLLLLTGGGPGELAAILEMLQAYLPEMVNKDAGLASEMNQWMK
jgi:hypothetical protein